MSTSHPSTGESEGRKMLVSMAGAGADEHDIQPPGANELSVKAGHEPDRFGVTAILYVPALVVVVLVVTYVIISTIFSTVVKRGYTGPVENPQVVSVVDRPINDRFATISSTEPKPVSPNQPDTKVAQPRLEYLKQVGDSEDPTYVRSKRPYQAGNSPELYPESLRPANYIDPATGEKVLLKAEEYKDAKGVARIPIDDALILATQSGKLKLPVRKDSPLLVRTTEGQAKISNGGAPVAAPAKPSHDVANEKHDLKH